MQRRGSVRFGASLTAIVAALLVVAAMVVVLLGPVGLEGPTSIAFATTPVTPADDAPSAPSDTVTDFYPESSNLSDCVGLVEKPGCGSESRGGWRQTVVFVVLFVGLGVILWRVSRGIKANRAVLDAAVDPHSDRS